MTLTFFIDASKWADGFWDTGADISRVITSEYNGIGESNSSLNLITMDTAVVGEYGSKINVLEQAVGTLELAQTVLTQLIVDSGTTLVLEP